MSQPKKIVNFLKFAKELTGAQIWEHWRLNDETTLTSSDDAFVSLRQRRVFAEKEVDGKTTQSQLTIFYDVLESNVIKYSYSLTMLQNKLEGLSKASFSRLV